MYFEGHAASLNPLLPATIQISFDWHLDPTDPPGDPGQFSPPVAIVVPASGIPIYVPYIIPICPPWVSIHIQTDVDVNIEGVFVHQCIPEPGQYALVAGLGTVAFGLLRRRFRV